MNIGLIFAGGSGVRMNTKGLPKQFLEMNGKAIIIHTIEHFEKCKAIDAIVIVCLKDYIEYLEDLLDRDRITKVKKIVPGGSCGQESIYHGLCAAEEISENEDDIILIHDGVRPLISGKLIHDNINMVKEKGNAIPQRSREMPDALSGQGIPLNRISTKANVELSALCIATLCPDMGYPRAY